VLAAADTFVVEALLKHLFGLEQVAAVNYHRGLKKGFNAFKIRVAEFVPLGYDHQGIGTPENIVGLFPIGDSVAKRLVRLFHRLRVVSPDGCTCGQQILDQHDRRGFGA